MFRFSCLLWAIVLVGCAAPGLEQVDEVWRVAEVDGAVSLFNPETGVAVEVADRGRVTLRARGGVVTLQDQEVRYDGAAARLDAGEPEVGPCVVGDPRRTPDGDCVHTAETRRAGVRSWWRNEPEGARQGWTIDGPGGARELSITVGAAGERVAVRDGRIEVGAAGRGLVGSDLRAWDANGRALPIRLEALPGAFRLAVDVGGAAWPVTVDPLWSEWTWTAGCDEVRTGEGMITPDLDHDGLPEIVTSDSRGLATLDGEGLVQVYAGRVGGPAMTPDVVWAGGAADRRLGRALARGDYNGDGVDDAAIGTEDGVSLWFGQVGALPAAEGFSWTHPPATLLLSKTLATGDLTGDGVDDLVVGVEGRLGVGSAVYVIAGGAAPAQVWSWVPVGGAGGSFAVGDTDGDGWKDLVVGAPELATGVGLGSVLVFSGSAAGLPPAASTTLGESTAGWSLTGKVGVADLNGDGRDEIYAGADDRTLAAWGEFAARVEVFDNGPAPAILWPATMFSPSSFVRVDANADGYEDLLVGDPMDRMEGWTYHAGNGSADPTPFGGAGQLQLFLGASTFPSAPARTWSDQDTSALGDHLDVADIDQDGVLDALSSTASNGCVQHRPGILLAIPLEPDPNVVRGLVAYGSTTGHVGAGVSTGDLDGDGYDDLLVGVVGTAPNAGGALLLRGSSSGLGAPEPFGWMTGDQRGVAWTAVGDMDGDGQAEALVTVRDFLTGVHRIQRWRVPVGGPPVLLGSFRIDPPLLASEPQVADLDADGRDELVVKTEESRVVAWSLLRRGGVSAWSPMDPTGSGWDVLDYDGDGVDDLALGSERCGAPPPGVLPGTPRCVRIWRGRPGMPAAAPTWELFAAASDYSFGVVLASGEVDASPGDDLVVDGTSYAGKNLGYFSGGSSSAPVEVAPGMLGNETGLVVADFTGDGHVDVVVESDEGYAWKPADERHLWLLPGGAHGLSGQPAWSLEEGVGPLPVGVYTDLALAAGDFNGDGVADLAVGASDRLWMADTGAVYALYGSVAGLALEPPVGDADGDGLLAVADCDDHQAALGGPALRWGDPDGDGYGDVEVLTCSTVGMIAQGGDCSEMQPMGAVDRSVGVDLNCDGQVLCFEDGDGDGDGTATRIVSADPDCTDPGEQRWAFSDCDDLDPLRAGNVAETTGDGIDGDCDNLEICWADADGDGFAGDAPTVPNDADCADPGEAAPGALPDCDDADAALATQAPEVVGDGVDQDCDHTELCFVDADRDGRAEAGTMRSADTDCLDRYEVGVGAQVDLCVGDERTGDVDGDGLCGDLDTCPATPGLDEDLDGVCAADLCVGDDALGDSDGDGWCDGVDFRLAQVALSPGASLNLAVTGAPPRARVWWFVSTAGAGVGPCVPALGLCLDITAPVQIGDRLADAQGRASVSLTVPATLPTGLPLVVQAAWITGGSGDVSNVWATTTVP